jgi:hypothetical protein
MKKKTSTSGDSAIELLEEAVHLLRGAPAGLYGVYALGVLPFVLGFLYFWADMSRGAFARDHIGRGAVAMAALFLWMKCWQAVFAAGLRSQRTGQPGAPWTPRRLARLALTQTALQSSGLFILPLALLVMIPFAWAFAVYQNLSALGAESAGLRGAWNSAVRQSNTRSGQNHLLIGLLSIFAFFVWLNVVTAMGWLPYLLKTLFGVETAFTQAGFKSIFNTTYFACTFALTYLFVDPLVKAAYVLRCFYGQSLQTGDDLKSELAGVRAAASMSVPLLAVVAFFSLATPILADSPAGTKPPATAVSPADLNRSIDEVLRRPEFAWRMPRVKEKDSGSDQTTWYGRAIESVVNTLTDMTKYCLKELGNMMKWISDFIHKLWPESRTEGSYPSGWGTGWASSLQMFLLILIVVTAGLLAVLIIRLWRRRRQPLAVTATAVAALPDLNDENIAADQLPEEGWLKMARDMMSQGNLRLALRAYYLAGLASLGAREIITIASFKSNREYEMELRRRPRVLPVAQTAFSQNVAAFDRAWYGMHEVTPEALQQFQLNFEQIRAC